MPGAEDEQNAVDSEIQPGADEKTIENADSSIEESVLQEENESQLPQTEDDNPQSGSDSALKKEISALRDEAAKYRISARDSGKAKEALEQKLAEVQKDFEAAKQEKIAEKQMRMLDRAGCLKSELVVKAVPGDCENIDEWVENYRKENPFLFKSEPVSHGSNFKPAQTIHLTPSQHMNMLIRQAAGVA
jgi:hypothetical protein